MKKYLNGGLREVVWSEMRDNGGMFRSEVGVWQDSQGYVAFILDWGGGASSPHHPDLETARKDIDRLWGKFYG